MHRRSLTTLVLIATLLVSFWPAPAHAINWLTDSPAEIFFSIIEGALEVAGNLLKQFLAVLGTLLNLVIGQPELNYGGAAVYTIWKIFRDICNMLFIVLFIFVAFGTIFNAIKGNAFYYRSALMGVIVAAIAINFSLAIGQTIVWAGNAASGLVTNLISGKDIGARIAVTTQVSQLVMGQQPGLPVAVVASAPFTGNAKTAFDNCQKFNQQPTVDGCVAVAVRIQAVQNAAAIDYEISRLNQSPSVKSRLQDAWNFWSGAAKGAVTGAANGLTSATPGSAIIGAAKGAWNGASIVPQPKETGKLSASEHVQKILSLILNVFLLLVLTLSFVTVIFFLVLRIPMIWLLLAFSSLAFFSIAWPGSAQFKKWFNNLLGWCVFSPLYLFVIYIGLFLLEQQNTLLAGMKNAAFISGSFGVIMFYGMTAAIFIGGARYAMKYSFALSSSAGTLFGKIGGITGVSEESRFGINTMARGVGATAAYETLKATGEARLAKLKQVGGNIANRIPGSDLFRIKSYDEKLARMKSKMSVLGGDKEFTDVQAKNVNAEQERLKSALALREPGKHVAYLRQQANSSNKNVALAAREMLLARGDDFMDAGQKKTTRDMYPNEGAKRAFDDRIKRSAGAANLIKKKEAQVRREEIIATVGAIKLGTAPTQLNTDSVEEMLDPYFVPKAGAPPPDKKEQAAYMEALGLKDPGLLFDYLRTHPDAKNPATPETDRARAFAPLLKKPENALELHEDFFKDPVKLKLLQDAFERTYPTGTGKAGQKRLRAKERLRTDRPEMENEINLIFP